MDLVKTGESSKSTAVVPEKKKKQIPRVAFYVLGAAGAVSIGLTVLVIPFIRQAAKLSNPTQFLSHAHTYKAAAPRALARSPELEDLHVRWSRFNEREERLLYGSPSDEGTRKEESLSALTGFKALGIATALVLGSAGLGIFGIWRVMGMREFTDRMKGVLETSMPGLIDGVNKPDVEDPNQSALAISEPFVEADGDSINEQAVDRWVERLESADKKV
ncbi:hypothetical protein P7C73_g6391, partial [Tremellales sp. Uapishka_1]